MSQDPDLLSLENTVLILGEGEWGGFARALNKVAEGVRWRARSAGYDSWLTEILNPASRSRTSEERVWVFLLSPRALDDVDLESRLESFFATLAEAAGLRTVFFSTLFADPYAPLPLTQASLRAERVDRINAKIRAYASAHPWFYVFDVPTFVLKEGLASLHDPRFEASARYFFHPGAQERLAAWLLRHLQALHEVPAKVIALDLDNTLWGGILGEDGPQGIRVGEQGSGLHYSRFQKHLLRLKEEGFLLVALSKNNEAEVKDLFHAHPEMPLRWSDFTAHAVNWLPKAENIVRLAEELNVGRDAFLLVDDSPHERAEMRARLPEVKIFDFPNEASRLTQALSECVSLDRLRSTREDRQRVQSYQENAQRAQLQKTATTLEDYYASLDLRVEMRKVGVESEERLHQLLLKTNQFHLNPLRPTLSEFRASLQDPLREFWSVRVSDSIGDSGITGLVDLDVSQGSGWKVNNFLLSCRVLGRTVEFAVLSWLVERAQKAKVTNLFFVSQSQGRNQPAMDFLQQVEPLLGSAAASGAFSSSFLPKHYAKISVIDI